MLVRSRIGSGYGPLRIRAELSAQHGLDAAAIEAAGYDLKPERSDVESAAAASMREAADAGAERVLLDNADLSTVEKQLARFSRIEAVEIAFLLVVLYLISLMLPDDEALTFMVAGTLGLVTFIAVEAVGTIMELTQTRRGIFKNMEYSGRDRVILSYRLPLSEILDIRIRNVRGQDVALRSVVTADPGLGPIVIERKAQQREQQIGHRDVPLAHRIHERLLRREERAQHEFLPRVSPRHAQRRDRQRQLDRRRRPHAEHRRGLRHRSRERRGAGASRRASTRATHGRRGPARSCLRGGRVPGP